MEHMFWIMFFWLTLMLQIPIQTLNQEDSNSNPVNDKPAATAVGITQMSHFVKHQQRKSAVKGSPRISRISAYNQLGSMKLSKTGVPKFCRKRSSYNTNRGFQEIFNNIKARLKQKKCSIQYWPKIYPKTPKEQFASSVNDKRLFSIESDNFDLVREEKSTGKITPKNHLPSTFGEGIKRRNREETLLNFHNKNIKNKNLFHTSQKEKYQRSAITDIPLSDLVDYTATYEKNAPQENKMTRINRAKNTQNISKPLTGGENSSIIAILDHFSQEVNQVKHMVEGKSDLVELRCNITGVWVSRVAGIRLNITTVSKSQNLHVSLNHTEPPSTGNLDPSWEVHGQRLMFNEGPFALIATNCNKSTIATFLGQCRVCDMMESIEGVWTFIEKAGDCREAMRSIRTQSDIFAKYVK